MDRLIREANPPTGQLASPKPQYKKPGVDEYEPVEGQHGAPYATIKDANGNVISPATEITLEQVKAELEAVKAELAVIKANQTSGDQKVTLSGTIDELRGLLADRPAPDAEGIVPGKTLYWAVDEGWVYATDGTVWHRVVEVGAWT